MDEGDEFLQEDVVINGFEDYITIQQFDQKRWHAKVTMSITQMKIWPRHFALPEGFIHEDRPDQPRQSGLGQPKRIL